MGSVRREPEGSRRIEDGCLGSEGKHLRATPQRPFQVVTPPLHHVSSLLQMFCMIVGSSNLITLLVSQL